MLAVDVCRETVMRIGTPGGVGCVLLALLSLGGCGGGGGRDGVDARTLVLSVDGWIGDGTLAATTTEVTMTRSVLYVGDTVTHSQRAFLGFSLHAIPAGATIRSATLRIAQGTTQGAPYAKLGNVYVDHVLAGPAGVAFSGGELEELLGMLSDDTARVWREVAVGGNVQADLDAGRTHSFFRLRFWQPAVGFRDAVVDNVRFEDFENSNGDEPRPPEIVVTYTP